METYYTFFWKMTSSSTCEVEDKAFNIFIFKHGKLFFWHNQSGFGSKPAFTSEIKFLEASFEVFFN